MKLGMWIGFAMSLFVVFVTMPSFIEYLKKLSLRQTVSEYALEDDKKKAGTPIMGGVLFIVIPTIIAAVTAYQDLMNIETWIVYISFVGYGLIGFVDDYLIAIKKNNEGLSPAQKFGMQVVLAVVFFFLYRSNASLEVALPFIDHPVSLGWGYFVLVLFMFTGSSNAVNLTDGMDGLSAGVSILALIPYTVIAYLQAKNGVVIFCTSLIGGLLGYLYYNKKPAKVFMGDTGALALGGVLAALAMITKTELLLVIIALVPVIETVCVMIQQFAVRVFHRRVFSYTPIHYAFRLKGMSEWKIVIMFWIVEAVSAGIGLWIYLG